ncbi:hypothetical protein THAOC_22180 [Thalassiosira oceanica]|uniref:Uncharacterized protein n=1 Tax=Thalassiosira oceanica TaxID=159749 RepID=K0RXQ8_THAOC|nr:hypothetical protein THAOC_22180 [Thalassiosira oceanica]|eukprot:EJK57745.1 hypothetical protein THAOC_22180 [Thalassiosira oceanica]
MSGELVGEGTRPIGTDVGQSALAIGRELAPSGVERGSSADGRRVGNSTLPPLRLFRRHVPDSSARVVSSSPSSRPASPWPGRKTGNTGNWQASWKLRHQRGGRGHASSRSSTAAEEGRLSEGGQPKPPRSQRLPEQAALSAGANEPTGQPGGTKDWEDESKEGGPRSMTDAEPSARWQVANPSGQAGERRGSAGTGADQSLSYWSMDRRGGDGDGRCWGRTQSPRCDNQPHEGRRRATVDEGRGLGGRPKEAGSGGQEFARGFDVVARESGGPKLGGSTA